MFYPLILTAANAKLGAAMLWGILGVLLLGAAAVVYLYIQKLKTAHSKVLAEKDQLIQKLRAELDAQKKSVKAALPSLSEGEILASIDAAMAAGEFQFYLQPEVDQFTKKIVGAEALARWVRPGKGVYSPGMFLPTLEKHGLVTKLDRYIFQQVVIFQHDRLKNKQPTVPISVNLSRVDMEDETLFDFMTGLLKQYQVPASLVPLEIAASAFADDIQWLSELVTKLREEQFYVGIDNLGKNELSLDILKDIPTDSLKLDIRSIRGGKDDAESRQLVSSVLRMGHLSSKNILVGSVETEEQASHLKYIGFRNAQGFLYHKPMPTGEFEKLIAPPKAKR